MKSFNELYILLEGLAEDFVNQNPDLKKAYDKGVKNIGYLKWLNSVKNQEPIDDIIPVVQAFDRNKQRLPQKDINFYKTVGDLRRTIESLGTSKTSQEKTLKNEETTKIGEFGDWFVVMPHTKESSCLWGKGTTWCTAATQSGNLFLNYSARKNKNVILYYLIKKGADPVKDPDSKISIGLMNGEPVMDGKDGGLTVNAANKGMKEEDLKRIIGPAYDQIINAIKSHHTSIGGEHPSKKQMEAIAASDDPSLLYEKYLRGMSHYEICDFLQILLDYKLSKNILLYIAKYSKRDHDLKSIFYDWLDIDKNYIHILEEENLPDELIYILLSFDYGNIRFGLIDNIIKYKKELTPNNVYDLLSCGSIDYVMDRLSLSDLGKLKDVDTEENDNIRDNHTLSDITASILVRAKNKTEMAEILGKKVIDKMKSEDILRILLIAKDRVELAEIFGEKGISKLSDRDIEDLLTPRKYYQPTESDVLDLINIIINYKKELNSQNVYNLLVNSPNIKDLAKDLGKEINKLDDTQVFSIIMHNLDKKKEDAIQALGQENINKLTDDQKRVLSTWGIKL